MDYHAVLNGPSKWDLITTFASGKSSNTLTFQTNGGINGVKQKLEVVVNGIDWESGGGENWTIRGWVNSINDAKVETVTRFEGYYKTNERKGHLSMLS